MMTDWIDPEPWREEAECKGMDPEFFFPAVGDQMKEQKAVCRRCPVIEECLEYALRTGQRHGVWGGKSERERRTLRRRPSIQINTSRTTDQSSTECA